MKKLIILVVTLVLLLLISTGVQAQDKYLIYLYSGDLTVPTGYDFELYLGWKACNRGLVKMFFANFDVDLTMNGVPLSGNPYYSEFMSNSLDGCIISPTGNQVTSQRVFYPIGELPIGEYVISGDTILNRRVTDGHDRDGDGQMEWWDISVWPIEFTLTVTP